MDAHRIAVREGNKAHEAAGTPEAAYDAYRKVYTETLARGLKAEEILAAGLVSPSGRAGAYTVRSQNGGRTYHVDLTAGTCDCADHQYRGAYCKHLQAGELYAHNAEDPGSRIVLEVEGYARGRQFLDKKLTRVRIGAGTYRAARSEDFDAALDWLRGRGYEFDQVVGPGTRMGTGTARYIYRRREVA